jgi:hypothetical protein
MAHLGKNAEYYPWQMPAAGSAGLVLFEYHDNLVFEKETIIRHAQAILTQGAFHAAAPAADVTLGT